MIEWLRKRPWFMALLVSVLVNVPAFTYAGYLIDCTSDWADRTAARSIALSKSNDELLKANDMVLRAAAGADREGVLKGLQDYKTASDRYRSAQESNPVPEPPRLACNLWD